MLEHRGEPHATVALGYQVESREARFEPDVARSTLQKPKSTNFDGSGDSFDGNVGLGGGGEPTTRYGRLWQHSFAGCCARRTAVTASDHRHHLLRGVLEKQRRRTEIAVGQHRLQKLLETLASSGISQNG
jgi:hypothetical protein